MPRKFKTPTSTAKNRESQRLSRARRQELVDNLKRRLSEYERRGAAATREMQAAARAVNAENRQLRELLALYGVSREQVDQFLASHTPPTNIDFIGGPGGGRSGFKSSKDSNRVGDSRESSENRRRQPTHQQQHLQPPHRREPVSSELTGTGALRLPSVSGSSLALPTCRSAAAEPRSQIETPLDAATTAPTPLPQVTPRDSTDEEERDNDADGSRTGGHCATRPEGRDMGASYSPSAYMLPPVSDCFCPQDPPAPPLGRTDALETSCDAAAAILVQLYSQADVARARAILGCTGTSTCSVANVRIFQLMDKLG